MNEKTMDDHEIILGVMNLVETIPHYYAGVLSRADRPIFRPKMKVKTNN